MQMRLDAVGQCILVAKGVGRSGAPLALAYSEVTCEVYTVILGEPDELVEVLGRVDSLAEALQVASRCPVAATGVTLIEAAALELNGDRYRW